MRRWFCWRLLLWFYCSCAAVFVLVNGQQAGPATDYDDFLDNGRCLPRAVFVDRFLGRDDLYSKPQSPPEVTTRGPTEVMTEMWVTSIEHRRYDTFSFQFFLNLNWSNPHVYFLSNGICDGLPEGNLLVLGPETPKIDNIWRPNIQFNNALDSECKHPIMIFNPRGFVQVEQKCKITVNCISDYSGFPADVSECTAELVDQTFVMSELDLQWTTLAAAVTKNHQTARHSLSAYGTKKSQVQYPQGPVSVLEVKFHMKRHSGYSIFSFYLPSLLSIMFAWFSLFISPHELTSSCLCCSVILGLVTLLSHRCFNDGTSKSLCCSQTYHLKQSYAQSDGYVTESDIFDRSRSQRMLWILNMGTAVLLPVLFAVFTVVFYVA